MILTLSSILNNWEMISDRWFESMEELIGSIERLTYYNEESFFTVAQLCCSHLAKTVTIVGTLPAIQVGETIQCKGEWKKHLKHGRQFEITEYSMQLPSDAKSIEKFLASGAVKGIGPAYASRIVQTFGNKTIEVLENSPNLLYKVEGLGEKRADRLVWPRRRQLTNPIQCGARCVRWKA